MAACGGGGGGGGGGVTSSSSTVEVNTGFSKGLFLNADVQAYEVRSGQLAAIGAKGDTGPTGVVKLNLPQTTNPVIIEMTTRANTVMLDETQGFTPVTPKVGTKIRTLLTDVSGTNAITAYGNLFTEMTVAGAANSAGGLSADSLTASRALIEQTVGFNPFSTKAIASSSESMSPDQMKLMTLSTALMFNAKSTPCVGDSLGLTCEINRLNGNVQMTSANGSYGLSNGAALVNDLSQKVTSMPTSTVPFVNQVKSNAAVVTASLSVPTAVSASSLSDARDLKGFLNGMRDALIQTSNTLNDRTNEAKLRLDRYIISGTGDGTEIVSTLLSDNCSVSDTGAFTCQTNNTGLTSNGTGYNFAFALNSSNVRVPVTSPSVAYRASGTVSFTFNQAQGTLNISVNGSKVTSSARPVSDVNFSLQATGLSDGALIQNVTLTSLNAKLYDQASGSSKWARIGLDNLNLNISRNSAGGLSTTTLSAPIALTTSEGDSFTGTLNNLTIKEKSVSGVTSQYPISADVSLNVNSRLGAILGINLVATQDITNYNPDLPSSSGNQPNMSALLTLFLQGNETLRLTQTKTVYDRTSYVFRLTANSSTITISGITKRANLTLEEETPFGDFEVTSTGAYRALVRRQNSGSTSGEIFKGDTQIGVIQNGVAKVGGIEISLN